MCFEKFRIGIRTYRYIHMRIFFCSLSQSLSILFFFLLFAFSDFDSISSDRLIVDCFFSALFFQFDFDVFYWFTYCCWHFLISSFFVSSFCTHVWLSFVLLTCFYLLCRILHIIRFVLVVVDAVVAWFAFSWYWHFDDLLWVWKFGVDGLHVSICRLLHQLGWSHVPTEIV